MRRNQTKMMDPVRRGTTPTLIFDCPYDPFIIEGGYVTFMQRGEFLFEKKFSDDCVTIETGKVLVDLTQEETLQLTTADVCSAQMRFVFKYEKTAASGIYKIPVLDVLKGGEIR